MGRRRHALVMAALAAGIGGCGIDPSTTTPLSTPDASAAVADVCEPIDLRGPDGAELDLSGRWQSNSVGTYFMAQRESCLFWLGQNTGGDLVPAGAAWTNVFSGQILPSFVVAGPWSDVPAHPDAAANSGELELAIEFFTVDGAVWPALRLRQQEPEYVFGDSRWQPEATVSELATYVGTIGIEYPFCPWLEVDGERYELTGYVEIEGTHVFGGLSTNGVGIGERARVEARIGQTLGPEGCAPSAMVVRDLEPDR